MKVIRSYSLIMVLVCLACMTLMIASCGNSDNSSTPTAVYTVEYVPGTGMNAPMQGKTTFHLNITKTSDNSPAVGLTPTLSFTMHMMNGDTHTTPADLVSESTTTPGLYNCTAYYLMASGPTMGTWDMAVTVGGETTTFHPDVAMAMGTTTVRATLKGVTDKILSSSTGTATENRTYYLFNDGLTSAMGGSYTFKLFIAAKESIMSMPAIGNGSTLHDETNSAWTISSMTVYASTDGSTWLPATEGSIAGHWSVPGLSALTSGVTGTIYVQMNVGNGTAVEQKTTDGMAVSGANGYASFIVTPGM